MIDYNNLQQIAPPWLSTRWSKHCERPTRHTSMVDFSWKLAEPNKRFLSWLETQTKFGCLLLIQKYSNTTLACQKHLSYLDGAADLDPILWVARLGIKGLLSSHIAIHASATGYLCKVSHLWDLCKIFFCSCSILNLQEWNSRLWPKSRQIHLFLGLNGRTC